MPGETDDSILVGAHFDFVDEHGGRGVVDNWSGSSLLPSLFESLKNVSRHHSFVFVGFTNEEKGLVGSRYYVQQLTKEEVRKITAMINLDSLGTSTTKFELDRGDKKLANDLALVALNFKQPLNVVNVHRVGRSDSDSFEDRHIPTLNIHSITNETWPILHSRRDQLEAIDEVAYYDTYRLLTRYLAYLDSLDDR